MFWSITSEAELSGIWCWYRNTENRKVFHFMLLQAKRYDKISRKLKITLFWTRFGSLMPIFQTNFWKARFWHFLWAVSEKTGHRETSIRTDGKMSGQAGIYRNSLTFPGGGTKRLEILPWVTFSVERTHLGHFARFGNICIISKT